MDNIKIEPKLTILNIIEYLFAAIIILNCNVIWSNYEESSFAKYLKIFIIIVAVLYFLIFFNSKLKLNMYRCILLSVAIIAGYGIVYVLMVRYAAVNFLYFLIDIFCIYLVIKLAQEHGRGTGILYKYENLILILAVISLIFWLFGSTLGIISSTGNVYSSWTGTEKTIPSYFNLYFETQKTDSGLVRNSGIFTEAPMYNFVLCIALLVELFGRHKISKVRCAILLVTILTTVSMTGWCVAIVALFAAYLFRRSCTRSTEFIKVIIIPVALIAALVILYVLVLSKLGTESGMTRLDDFNAGFEAWKTNIWFGCGYGNNDYIQLFMSDFRSTNPGLSNSPTQILAQGGIFFAIPYLWFTYKWIQTSIIEKNVSRILFFVCFIFLFTFTITSYKFLVVFLFMSYSAIGGSNLNQEELPALICQRKKVLAGKFRRRFRFPLSIIR